MTDINPKHREFFEKLKELLGKHDMQLTTSDPSCRVRFLPKDGSRIYDHPWVNSQTVTVVDGDTEEILKL